MLLGVVTFRPGHASVGIEKEQAPPVSNGDYPPAGELPADGVERGRSTYNDGGGLNGPVIGGSVFKPSPSRTIVAAFISNLS